MSDTKKGSMDEEQGDEGLEPEPGFWVKLKDIFIGSALNPHDRTLFHKLSLIPFFAWVGLGADGLSSSCYGPEEAFLALQGHHYLAVFVALASVLTILVISSSYSQIIELFPTGGGGYLVASKLLSPGFGMVSGCALLIDYVLTITISVASGADAIFSFLPPHFLAYKLWFAGFGVLLLTLLNMRGAKESIIPLVPVFMMFLSTHAFAILYSLATHTADFSQVVSGTVNDVRATHSEVGVWAMIFMILRAYSLGAGTYTGIEAVSNGLPLLRDPKVQNGKKTMRYMAGSLAFVVLGLMLAYLLYRVDPAPGKTLNAVLFERLTADWSQAGATSFLLVTLFSEAAILFIAAQAGFLDGPRVLSSMALDRWFPSRFASLSDRFVAQNGILIMGISAIVLMLLTRGSVRYLVVLYSINVFITFTLSQLGMVRHWWKEKAGVPQWKKKIAINGVGLVLTSFILLSVTVLKFHEGGWITLFVTGTLAAVAVTVKRHYNRTLQALGRLDNLIAATEGANLFPRSGLPGPDQPNFEAKTAVLMVNGFNGLGLHTLFNVVRFFGDMFSNYVFVQVGVIDAGNFKGALEVQNLEAQVNADVGKYVEFMKKNGFYSESFGSIANDVVEEVSEVAPKVLERFPNAVFFGGQLVFPHDTFLSRFLHNYTVFAMQRKFYQQGIPVVILPIRV